MNNICSLKIKLINEENKNQDNALEIKLQMKLKCQSHELTCKHFTYCSLFSLSPRYSLKFRHT